MNPLCELSSPLPGHWRVGHYLTMTVGFMGFWGTKPFENDEAADWFRDLWLEFPVPTKVEETLALDVETSHAHIRAAIHVLLQLGDTYQWPVDAIDRHLRMAIAGLEKMLELGIYTEDGFRSELEAEIQELKSRL